MELIPPKEYNQISNTHRLIPSRYPTVGIFDDIAHPEDLKIIYELEGWTNDRLNGELGLLHCIAEDKWVLGVPNATVIMAAFCHPSPQGGRFTTSARGAWYSAFELETAIKETAYHRQKEFAEVGQKKANVCMRGYLSDFKSEFHDIRNDFQTYKDIYDPESYKASQSFAEFLEKIGSNGILYNSVRSRDNYCIAVFDPRLVHNVRQGNHFQYNWDESGNFEWRQL